MSWEWARLLNHEPASNGSADEQASFLVVFVLRLVTRLFVMGDGAKWVLGSLAVGSLVMVMAAVALYFIGSGIEAGRPWARTAGIVAAAGPLVCSLAMMGATMRHPFLMSMAAGPTVASGFVIWALLWRVA